jgi:DNA-binding PadR family transcriptional regulator
MTARPDPSGLLPLTPAMFHVLLALAEDERHGYAIIKDVEARTDGSVRLSAGTLYGLVKRLLADGLIEESSRRPPAGEDDERRRYYRLAAFGRKVLAAEVERLERAVEMARATKILRKTQIA